MKTTLTTFMLSILFQTAAFCQAQDPQWVRCSDESTATFEGVLVNSSSTRPKMRLDQLGNVQVGARGELSKHFEMPLFGGTAQGWLVIGMVEVVSTDGNEMEMKVHVAKSVVTINGAEKNHFVAGKQVRFVSYDYGERKVHTDIQNGLKVTGPMVCGKKVGTWQQYYANGNLKLSQSFNEKSQWDGPVEEYYENGVLKMRGQCADHKKEGQWEFFHENSQLASRCNYREDRVVGEFLEWHFNGKPKTTGEYSSVDEEKQGVWTKYRQDGSISRITTYDTVGFRQYDAVSKFELFDEDERKYQEGYEDVHEEVQGPLKTFYENGACKSIYNYRNGRMYGVGTVYFQNGNIEASAIFDENQRKSGKYVGFFESGAKSGEGEYLDDNQIGKWKYWYENGEIQAEEEYNNLGLRQGTWQSFYENGKPKSLTNFSSDILVGKFQNWYENGQIKESAQLTDLGKKTGKYASYYSNGKIKEKGDYEEDKKVGKWVSYDEDGKKTVTEHAYFNGCSRGGNIDEI